MRGSIPRSSAPGASSATAVPMRHSGARRAASRPGQVLAGYSAHVDLLVIGRLKREVDRLAGELDRQRRVVEIQGKLSALLEQLATDSKADYGEQR